LADWNARRAAIRRIVAKDFFIQLSGIVSGGAQRLNVAQPAGGAVPTGENVVHQTFA
jgi:hypothetical protein